MTDGSDNLYCSECGKKLKKKTIEDRERFYCKDCEKVQWQNPKPVAWILVESDNKHLLVKRANNPDKGEWDIPGGFLEVDESFREAAVRELEEETGVKVPKEKPELADSFSFNRDENYVTGVLLKTKIDEFDQEITPGSDAADAKFWKPERIETTEEKLRKSCKNLL